MADDDNSSQNSQQLQGMPPGVTFFARPLNIGNQPIVIGANSDVNVNMQQVPALTKDGNLGKMNFGKFINLIVNATAADKDSVAKLAEAVSQNSDLLKSQEESTNGAIDKLNTAIGGQGRTIKDVTDDLTDRIVKLESRADMWDNQIADLKQGLSDLTDTVNANYQNLSQQIAEVSADAADNKKVI